MGVLCVMGSYCTSVAGQENNVSIDAGVEILSRYVWRGMPLSSSPVIQPSIELNNRNVFLGAWGSYTTVSNYDQEVDLYVGYSIGNVTFTLYDYFVFNDSLEASAEYFNWKKGETAHTLESILTINEIFNTALAFEGSVMLYGDDINDAENSLYSTYLKLLWNFTCDEIELKPYIGITPAAGLYGSSFNLVNIGMSWEKEFSLSDHLALPAIGSFGINPVQENIYITVGLTF